MARRHSEDSVIASIDQVQAMLRDEVKPAPVAELALPPEAATQVTHRAGYRASEPSDVDVLPDLSVPTAAEVEASRAARWAEEAQAARVVTRRRGSRGVLRVLGALALLAAGAGAGWWAHTLRPAPWSAAAEVVAADTAVAQVVVAHEARLQAKAQAEAAAELLSARAQVSALSAEVASLKAASAAAVPPEAEAAKPEPKSKPKRTLRRRKARRGLLVTRPGRERKQRRRRPARRLNRQDKKLDALIQGL